MNKLVIATAAALLLTTLSVQADEAQPAYADYNKALLQIGVDPEVAAVVSQIALTKVQDMQLDDQQDIDK